MPGRPRIEATLVRPHVNLLKSPQCHLGIGPNRLPNSTPFPATEVMPLEMRGLEGKQGCPPAGRLVGVLI